MAQDKSEFAYTLQGDPFTGLVHIITTTGSVSLTIEQFRTIQSDVTERYLQALNQMNADDEDDQVVHTIIISEKHNDLLEELYDEGKLMFSPGDAAFGNPNEQERAYGDLDMVFNYFVERALEMQWSLSKLSPPPPPRAPLVQSA